MSTNTNLVKQKSTKDMRKIQNQTLLSTETIKLTDLIY